MKQQNLSIMNLADLVQRFAVITREQDMVLLEGHMAKFNKLFEDMKKFHDELKKRPGDQRRALMQLYDFPNMQVRLQASKLTLAVAPIEARAQLAIIAASRWIPQADDAGMSLFNLENGIFKPT